MLRLFGVALPFSLPASFYRKSILIISHQLQILYFLNEAFLNDPHSFLFSSVLPWNIAHVIKYVVQSFDLDSNFSTQNLLTKPT